MSLVTPSPNSALIMNDIVNEYQKIISAKDISVALEEFGIGAPNSVRLLDVCFGLSTGNSSSVANDCILNTGLVRVQQSATTTLLFSFGGATENLATLLLNDIASSTNNNNITVENSYVFGSIYLYRIYNSGPQEYQFALGISTAKGGNPDTSPPAMPIVSSKDFTINEAIKILEDGTMSGSISGDWGTPLEIIRWMIDIKSLSSIDNSSILELTSSDYSTYFYDLRQMRGWGGFAEENMATNLLPSIINFNNIFNSSLAALDQIIINLVARWVGLTCWSPDFITYWNNQTVPPALGKFLFNRFGLSISISNE